MIPLFNLRGYTAYDPLDDVPARTRSMLAIGVTSALTLLLCWLEFSALAVVRLRYDWLMWVEVAAFGLLFSQLVLGLRKTSSILLALLVPLAALPVEIWMETHHRLGGEGAALWTYTDGTFLMALPPLVRFLVAWTINGILLGPVALWVARLIGRFFVHGERTPRPTPEEQERMFPDEWTEEHAAKPERGFEFHLLRILGFSYLAYLLLLMLGLCGTAVWPEDVRTILEMTYANPPLMINTFVKLAIMITLTFIAAFNRELRWHCTLFLLVGHLVSTAGSLGFLLADPEAEYAYFLRASAIVDGAMVLGFAWIMMRNRKLSERYAREKEFPEFFSIPHSLTRTALRIYGELCIATVIGVLLLRLFTDGSAGLGAVFGYPDPQICNTITKYATLGLIALVLAGRDELRESLIGIILGAHLIGLVGNGLWPLVGDIFGHTTIVPRTGTEVTADWYYVLAAALNGAVVLGVFALRATYYTIDFSITTFSPDSARNVIALHDALHGGDADEHGAVLQSIDAYAGGIRGRRRGLLNFPFLIMEYFPSVVYGLRPGFSKMSRAERLFMLRRYILRRPIERARSWCPELAEICFKLGTAAHGLITLAHYSGVRGSSRIGYVPPDARDRLQGDYPAYRPPFKEVAPLPTGPADRHNFKPRPAVDAPQLIAPRVGTPVGEPEIPEEVDYLIVGSGAGGAVAAYRLACSVDRPDRILVVERGPRYSPLQDFNDRELEMIRKLYKEGGLQQTKRFDLVVMQGECVGGSTVINNAVCLEMPEHVRNEWRDRYDIDLELLDVEYERIAAELGIAEIEDNATNRTVADLFVKGVTGHDAATGAGLTPDKLTVNVRNGMGDGLCNIGNKRMRKRSMLETYIPWAEARGVKVIGDTSAVRFIERNGRAEEVMLRTSIGRITRVKVRKAVVVAGGVIASTHFLMRSGVTKNTGKRLSCNFAMAIPFEFDERIDAFDGSQMTMGALDPKNRAVFETYFNPPATFALSLPFFLDRHADLMGRYRYLLNFAALVGSEPNGVIERTADLINGRPFDWHLGPKDGENIRFALTTLLRIGEKAGAKRAMLPTIPGIEMPVTTAAIDRFEKNIADYPLTLENLRLTTAHPQGGNLMAGDGSPMREHRVVDGSFRVEGMKNVFVVDASIFPTGITVNPQWTIMAMSSLAAFHVLQADAGPVGDPAAIPVPAERATVS